jgi:dTDP-4-amino-4,6-dideoxygalactose transaminase
MTRIPFNKPTLEGRELDYMRAVVEGGHTASSGGFSAKVVDLLREAHGAADTVLTTSCTAALEMSAILLDLEPGDTVIVPSFTFVTTALAYVREGARVVFADIDPATLGIDPAHVAQLMDDSVRAVVTVHYAGVGSDIAGLREVLAGNDRVDLVEDNAHGLFGTYQGAPLGSFGRFSTLSFHETKNFVCGEGGALVLNDARDVDRAHVVLDKGTNRRAFMLGQVDKYSWVDVGSSFGLSDLLAGYLLGQLEMRETILAKRRHVYESYERLLAPHAADLGITLPVIPTDRTSAYHMYHVLLSDGETRDRALVGLGTRGVHATFHYVPLHTSAAGRRYAARQTDCPVTDDVSARLMRLPFHNGLTDGDIERVVETLISALGG